MTRNDGRVNPGTMQIRAFALLLILLVMLACRPAPQSSERGVIAKYQFDEGAGQTVRDSSGNKHDGVIVGDAKWVDGLNGKAILFTGLNRVTVDHV